MGGFYSSHPNWANILAGFALFFAEKHRCQPPETLGDEVHAPPFAFGF
jgi:hypothetical protein